MLSTGAHAELVPAFHFSTNQFPQSERLTAWQELLGRRVLKLEIEPLPARSLYCDIKMHSVPRLAMLFGSCSGARLARTKSLVESDDFTFAVSTAGQWHVSQRGREAALGAGDAILVSKAETMTMTISGWRGVMFRIPAPAIAPLMPDPYGVVGRAIPATSPALKLLVAYLGQLRNGAALTNPELQRLIATHVHDLVAVALGATREAAEIARDRSVRVVRLQAIATEINQRFADPHLSPAIVAERLRLSPRYVQDLLHEAGTSFTGRVVELRLERARAMLESAINGHRKVIDIAYSCGFNDLSYFNRCFRRRFGASPTQFRSARITEVGMTEEIGAVFRHGSNRERIHGANEAREGDEA